MIEIKNVSKTYEKNEKVIDGLDLKINDGEIFGFIGLNGAGKTTVIKMITGILEIDEGDILIDSFSIISKPLEAKKRIGLVPDSPDIFLKMKGIEYLKFMADVYKVPTEIREEKVARYAKQFKIFDNLNDKIGSYSHGMRQKIVIIGALLHEPQNLILDEPITGLDPKSSFDLKSILKKYTKEGKTVFFSTHILEIAEKLCDRIGIIDKGVLKFVGTIDELKDKYGHEKSLEEIFINIVEKEEN